MYLGVCKSLLLVSRPLYNRVVSCHENNYVNCNVINVTCLVTAKFAYAVNLNNYFNLYSGYFSKYLAATVLEIWLVNYVNVKFCM
jgi:hypothetical protein